MSGESPAEGTDEGRPEEIADAADSDRPLWALLGTHAKPDGPLVGWGVFASAMAQVLSNADMFIVGLAFDAMFNDQAYDLPLVPNDLIPTDPVPILWFTITLLVTMKLVDLCFGITGQYAWNVVAQRVQHRVRVSAFDAVQRLDVAFFDERRTGEVMSVLNNDVNRLEEFLTDGPQMAIFGASIFVTSVAYMAIINWQLALISLALAPVVAVVNLWFSRRHEERQDAVRSETGVLNALLQTNISGIPVVKAFGGEAHETERVSDASADYRDVSWDATMVGVAHRPGLRMLAGLAFVATFFVGTEWVLDGSFLFFSGTLTAGELIPFVYYTQNLVTPMRTFAWVTGMYKGATSAAKRVLGVQRLGTSEATTDAAAREDPDDDAGSDSTPSPSANGQGSIARDGANALDDATPEPLDVDGDVTYDDVTFTYPGADEPAIRAASFDAASGETVGLVGSTGAGKSTLMKLLLRFYAVDDGEITLDGRDVEEYPLDALRRSVGYVAQDPFLFSGTVRENVAYAVAEASDDEVEEACRRAAAHGFIRELDDGYETQVGERGARLSGGQRQRIALARVLLADPPILVLDEATSHVDNRTEVLIQRQLDEITADRTTFVVAHRLSTVRDADTILVLDDGEIVERGGHEELLDRGGQYADLWSVQVGAVADD